MNDLWMAVVRRCFAPEEIGSCSMNYLLVLHARFSPDPSMQCLDECELRKQQRGEISIGRSLVTGPDVQRVRTVQEVLGWKNVGFFQKAFTVDME